MDPTTPASTPLPRGPLLVLAICWLLLIGTLLVPQIPLDGPLAIGCARVAYTGGRWVFPFVVAAVVLLLVTRIGLTMKQRVQETLVLSVIFVLLFGVGSWLNEQVLKPILDVERPNVLASDENGTLGTSLESYYGFSSQERGAYMKELLENEYFTGEKLAAPVRNHWIASHGLARPSSQSLGAFALLTFALIAASTSQTGKVRIALVCLIAPWAIAVAYSRVLLRVHWPVDVILAGMFGILLGLGAFALARRLLWSKPVETDAAIAPI